MPLSQFLTGKPFITWAMPDPRLPSESPIPLFEGVSDLEMNVGGIRELRSKDEAGGKILQTDLVARERYYRDTKVISVTYMSPLRSAPRKCTHCWL
jgi:hypothetical protein